MDTLPSRILYPALCVILAVSCVGPNSYQSAIDSLTEREVRGEMETIRIWVPVGEDSNYRFNDTECHSQKRALEDCISYLAAFGQESDQATAAGRVMQCMAKKSWVLVPPGGIESGT